LIFEYYNPVKLWFGPGQLARVGEAARQYGNRALIVTSGSSARTGVLEKAIASLKAVGLDYAVYDKVRPNPLIAMVEEAANLALSRGCEVVIGIGGGSAMDTAKGAAFAAVNGGDFAEYFYGKPGTGALPIILVTTTAGTGSEGNSIAVFTNQANNDKKGLKSPYLYPKISIVDPEVFVTVPPRTIAAAGMDALFHAIEAYISQRHNFYSDMLALRAISLLAQYLPRVYAQPQDVAAWGQVGFANTLAGMAIDIAGTTLPHAMEHPLSGLLNITHGEGLAALYPAIMEFSCRLVPDRFAAIAQALDADIAGMDDLTAAARSVELVRELLAKVNLNVQLADLGVKEEHLEWLTANTFKTMKTALGNHPERVDMDQVRKLYKLSL